MPRGASPKRERQYEHIKQSAKKSGRYGRRAEEVAARTVNKIRREKGETKSQRSRSKKSSARSTSSKSRPTKSRSTGSRTGSRKSPTKRPRRASGKGRGFAGMSEPRQRAIAAEGGRAAHERGTAHEFSAAEARKAGQKGGVTVSRDRSHMARIGRKGGER
jgi:hypothetical protein